MKRISFNRWWKSLEKDRRNPSIAKLYVDFEHYRQIDKETARLTFFSIALAYMTMSLVLLFLCGCKSFHMGKLGGDW